MGGEHEEQRAAGDWRVTDGGVYLRKLQKLTSPQRDSRNNYQIGSYLAFVAGAVNAGGFLAIGRYTSHLTGIISSIADDAVLGHMMAVTGGLILFFAFLAGAATSAIMINWGERKRIFSKFALPLLLEAVLLLLFGLVGANLDVYRALAVPFVALLLSYVMGLQNALLTTISSAQIRTTHMTGLVTDLGIEIGKLLYWNRAMHDKTVGKVMADRVKMKGLILILSMFSVGGITGAYGFARIGYISVVPLAAILLLIALSKIYKDIAARRFMKQ